MPQVRLRLLGMPLVEADDEPVRFENRKAVALLAYLAVTRQAHSRERLALLLWPDIAQSLAALRTALWELRKKTGDHYLNISRQGITLTGDESFSSDVFEYTSLLQASSESIIELPHRIDLLQRAVNLYQDDFMAGFSLRDSEEYDDWQNLQIAHFQRLQQRALLDLITLYEQARDPYAAIQTAERLRSMDALAQEPVAALMRLYDQMGQRQSVLRLYEEFASALHDELGVPPSGLISSLYQSLLNPLADAKTSRPAIMRPVTGPLVAGDVSALIYRSPETVKGRPRKMFGRDDLVSHALNLLLQGEQVMLTGMGGIGKTSTAAAVAAAFIEASDKPVIWLETGFQKTIEIILAIARTFNQQQSVLTKPDPAAYVMQLLAAQNGLLVLDNCWNASALFEVMTAIPNTVPVLLTSRQRIPIDGEVIAVDMLSKNDARALLEYHARRSFAEDPDVDALIRSLGNHPYALEIAGKQLKAQPGLSTKVLRSRYMKATREIAVVNNFGAEGRQSIEHIISTSVDNISSDAQKILLQMGSLAAPHASIELVALMLDADIEMLESGIGELEQSSLIEIDYADLNRASLLRMHDLTFNYCRDRFKQSGLDRSMLVRAVEEYVRRCSRETTHMEVEFTNIMGAVRAASHLNDHQSVIFIIRALMVDGYFDAFGYTPELLDHLDEAIRLAQGLGAAEQESYHYLLSKRANVFQMQGNLEKAFEENLEALVAAPNPQRRALLVFTLATIAFRLNRDEYQVYLQEAESVARTHDIQDVLSRIVDFRGHIALNKHDLLEARQHFESAVHHAENLNMPDRYFWSLYNLAYVEIELGNYDRAIVLLERVNQLADEQQNQLWKAMFYSSIARCVHARGDRDETFNLMTKALGIYERAGNLPYANWVHTFLRTEGYPSEKISGG